jgi:hypothetical protein
MMKMTDWWSKKLSGEKPTAPRPTFTPPVTPLTNHVASTTQQPITQTQAQPTVQPESFSEALKLGITNGGEAARRDTMTCPACGGGYVFSRTKASGGTTVAGNAPAPRCYTCGWNGIYHQGDESNWS